MGRRAGRRITGVATLLAAAALLVLVAPAWGGQAATIRLTCTPVGNTCTVRIPITAADEGAQVLITTPRKNTGAGISDSNHTPFSAMYNADETPAGMTFELRGVSSVTPGTVLIIVFKLVPAGAKSGGGGSTAGSASLKLHGPTSNKLGTSFTYVVSADTKSAAILEAFEEPGNSCAVSASTYPRSAARVHQTLPPGSLSIDFHLIAEPAGAFALCVYLVDPSTSATEARGLAHWTNHP